jgi:hypothetical protein
MYGGHGQRVHVAYVGVADSLKKRITQHLVRCGSSVTTGTSAVMLNPDYINEIRWWEHIEFQERSVLEAAELIAFDVFEPALRSRGAIRHNSKELHEDPDFRERMQILFTGQPAGRLILRNLHDTLSMIEALERRVELLERLLRKK